MRTNVRRTATGIPYIFLALSYGIPYGWRMEEVANARKAGQHAEKLRAARKARGFEVAEVAALAGVPKSSWHEYEGGAVPSATRAVTMAAALGETVESIWGSVTLASEDASHEAA